MAEGLLRHAIRGKAGPMSALTVCSAGIFAQEGSPASENAFRAMWAVGIDIGRHRSRQVTRPLVENALAIFAMGRRHVEDLRRMFPALRAPLHLLREFAPKAAGFTPDLPDPYGRGFREYQDCRDNIVETIPSLLDYLEPLLANPPTK